MRRITPLTSAWNRIGCRVNSADIRSHTCRPRTLLKWWSRSGENTAMPNWPGITEMTAPLTPLFAGMPTRSIHSPEASYIPQLLMTLITLSTSASPRARTPVTGFDPRLASVPAMIARSRQVTDTEHCRK
jgi:hypothetical protein